MRVGHGWDLHRLEGGRPMYLGGVVIPHPTGPVGHSDGDVVIHALVDAMLGAASLSDIGTHFPDTDPRWKGARSSIFLEQSAKWVREKGFKIANADLTVVLQEPKIGARREAILKNLAGILNVPIGLLNLKAKTHEGIGEIGRGEAIACHAVVLLEEV